MYKQFTEIAQRPKSFEGSTCETVPIGNILITGRRKQHSMAFPENHTGETRRSNIKLREMDIDDLPKVFHLGEKKIYSDNSTKRSGTFEWKISGVNNIRRCVWDGFKINMALALNSIRPEIS